MPKTHRAAVVLFCLMTLPTIVWADDSAAAWIEKMAGRADRGHYKVNIDADMNVINEGTRSVIKMKGAANCAARNTFRIGLDLSVDMGGNAMAVKMLTVADGKNFWVEMDSPMTGGKQVVTGAIGDLAAFNEMSGGTGMGGVGSDPIKEIRGIVDRFDMKVAESADGRVTLHANVSPEEAAELSDLGPFAASMTYIKLVLDEKEAMPVQLLIGAAEPIVTMNFAGYEFFGPDEVKAADYVYTPPPGVSVTNLSSMMLGQ